MPEKSKSQNNKEIRDSLSEEFDDKLLQSPVESHFALTPVTSSETSSPANGFTNQDSTDLLQQELDQLEKQQILMIEKDEKSEEVTAALELPTSISVDGLLSPTDEHVSMFSRNSNNRDDNTEIGGIGDNYNVQGIHSTNSGEVGYCF